MLPNAQQEQMDHESRVSGAASEILLCGSHGRATEAAAPA